MNKDQIRNIVEGALMVAGRPINIDGLLAIFGEEGRPERGQIREAIAELSDEYDGRGIEVLEVASGYRIQIRTEMSEWLSRLWQERPPRYSRALMETVALIAYRQPITRGEIEDVRGVSVSSNIIRTLLERSWIRVLGHRDVPGKPAMFGTTKEFLDYFGLRKLEELPTLAELRDIDSINVELDFSDEGTAFVPDTDAGLETDHAEMELVETDVTLKTLGQIRIEKTDEHPAVSGLEAEADVEDAETTKSQESPAGS
jgi:segregation and condensation protein B